MDRDTIIRLAEEAGLEPRLWNHTDAFERFAALVAAHERKQALAEPEQEPVAWVELTDEEQLELARDSMGKSRHWLVAQVEAALKEKNSAPTPRKPLTDEEIRGLADKHLFYQPEGYEVSGIFNIARAIERAHGIVEQKEKEWK